MKPTTQGNTISFSDALHIFWDWRLASISLEVSFFGKSRASETVRVSVDGLVTMVDPEGVVTISGDGREIELDLRGCEFARAGKTCESVQPFNALDPDSVLQVNFPHGEVCLVFPYRRVAHSPGDLPRAENGLEWLHEKLARVSGSGDSNDGLRLRRIPALDFREAKVKRAKKHSFAPPVFPLLAVLFAFAIVGLALAPVHLAGLYSELGFSQTSQSDPEATVWVIRQAGNYYCQGGVLFGRKPGQYMQQSEALSLGYQPALNHYCGGPEQSAPRVKRDGLLARIRDAFLRGRLILSIILSRSRSWLS